MPDLSFEDKRRYATEFIAIVEGQAAAEPFAAELAPRLANHATAAERELIGDTAQGDPHHPQSQSACADAAMARCVRIMSEGMVFYQGQETLDGLSRIRARWIVIVITWPGW